MRKIKENKKATSLQTRKCSQFLWTVLVSSALVSPAQGMMADWADLFDTHKSHCGTTHCGTTLGPKILGRLDDQSLGRAAQVSSNWQQLVSKVYDARYLQTALGKADLLSWILEAVEAEANEAGRAWQKVKEVLEDADVQTKIPADLKKKLLKIQPRLLQPEALILKDARDTFLSCSGPHKTHPALSGLRQVIEDLKALEEDLAHVNHRALRETLSALKLHYEQYVEKLLTPDADRAALLQPKVILSGEGLMDLRVHGFHSYRINQKKALSLLSKDRYGLLLKKNASGSHAVSHQGWVHFKGNTTSTGLPVGMEAAAYWFAQALFGRGMAPTALLTLNEVDMRTPPERTQARSDYGMAQATNLTSNDFFTSYPQHQEAFTVKNPHHVVQASASVEGISLEDFMKGAESGKYDYRDLDLNSFSEHIFMSFLINPSDGTPGNFMVNMGEGKPYSIVGIDNDMAFGPPVILTKAGKNTFKPCLEVKNVLYCLPKMCEPLSPEMRWKILKTSPELVLLRWLERLKIQLALYDNLKDSAYEKEGKAVPYLKEAIYIQELHLPLQLPSGLVSDVLDGFTKLQEKLRARPAITHEQLFSFLQPLVHRFYEALKTQHDTPLSAYQFIHNSDHENIFLEDVLSPYKQEVLVSGKTIAQALEDVHLKDVHLKDVHSTESGKKQSLNEVAQNLWQHLDLNAQPRVIPFLELAAMSFSACFQNKAHLHQSWLQDSLLCRALKEGVSDQGLSFLLKLGLNVGVRDSLTQQNALHYAIKHKYPLATLKLLLNSISVEAQTTLLNSLNHQGLTPMDESMAQNELQSFCYLRALGATSCNANIALEFYKRKVRSNSTLHAAFRELMALNGEVEWLVTLEELLPPLLSKKDDKGMSLTSSTYGYRQVPIEVKSQILDSQNNFIRFSTQGNHPVAYAHKRGPLKDHGLYFKLYPALPGLEEAAGGLTRQLLGFGAPYTDLVALGSFPCLISQEIPGDTLLKVLKTNPDILDHLDEEDISGMLVAAMLINPEDGKPDNYIITPHPTEPGSYRIVGIDNDQAFVPAIVKEKPDTAFFTDKILPIAQVKTVLYCLNQMKNPIDPHLRIRIINLHPDRFLENWLHTLKRVNNKQCGLFTGSEQTQAFQQQKCFIGVPFQQGAVRHLYEKFVQLRDLLTLHPNISHIDLLAKLEPRLAKRYQAALAKDISVEMRFREVDRPFYEVKLDSKRGESHTTVTQSGDILQSMGILLQEKIFDSIRLGKENGPVQALEELETIKKEKDEETLKSLAARVGDLNLLKTLTLEESRALFLKELDKQKKILVPKEQIAILDYLASQKGIRDLPLPNFYALDDIFFQKLSFEHLRIIDLRKCTMITNESLVHLSKTALGLEELNLGYWTQLKEIGDIGVFADAPLVFKQLRFLNLSHCINLVKLLIQTPNLHYLNIENCVLINDQMLDGAIEGSENLQKLVFEGCPLVGEKELREQYPNFPASYCEVARKDTLKILESKGSELTFKKEELDTAPQGLKAFEKALKTNIYLSNLTSLDLGWNKIGNEGAKALSQGNLTNLTSLNLNTNNIGDAGAKALSQGNLSNLTSLKLRGNHIGDKGAKALSHGNLSTLTSLKLRGNNIGDEGTKCLSMGNFSTLTSLSLSYNHIEDEGTKSLSQGNLSNLTSLKLRGNNIGDEGTKSLSQGNLSNLTSLDLFGNSIGYEGAKGLSQGNLSNLTSLKLRGNNIEAEEEEMFYDADIIGDEEETFFDTGNLFNLTYLDLRDESFMTIKVPKSIYQRLGIGDF